MARKYRHFTYSEDQRFIYPTSDWGFKHLFGSESNKDLLLGVLQELFPELGIKSIEYLPRDITIPVGKMKDASFDVYCMMHDGTRAVIEMQNYARKAFLDRALVYTSAAVLEHYVNSKTDGYRIGKTIFLAFVGDPIFNDVKRTPVRLSLCDIDESATTLRNENLLQVFVELPKFEGSLKKINEKTPFVEKLAYVLMEMADCTNIPDNLNDPLLEHIFKAADTSRMNFDMKDEYRKSIMSEADYEYHMSGAREEGIAEGRAEGIEEGRAEGRAEGREIGLAEGREEGLKEGRAEGRQEGLKEGRAEGRKEGREEGRKEGREEVMREMAEKMASAGLDAETIREIIG